jgi:hypothetical protein
VARFFSGHDGLGFDLKCYPYMAFYIFSRSWRFSAIISLNKFSMSLLCISPPSSTPWIIRFGLLIKPNHVVESFKVVIMIFFYCYLSAIFP